MSTTSLLKAQGLHTNSNHYSVPEGSQSEANNVVINREGVIEPRRGLTQYGTIGVGSTDTAKQLFNYKNRILANYQSTIAYDNGSGTFADFLAAFPETEANLRIKSFELNSNMYITTLEGIKKISAKSATDLPTALITLAGGIKALSGTGIANYSQEGFLTGLSKVGYRIVWGTKDPNNNLILGAPSSPIEVINQNTVSCVVDVTFQVPYGIDTNWFYRLYRTSVFTAASFVDLTNVVIDDEYNLVFEEGYTTGTEITVTDIVPQDYRDQATPLYTNENSGEGILQANAAPPFAKDITNYKNHGFFGNTKTKQSLSVDLLGLDGIKSYGAEDDTIDITLITTDTLTTTITFSAPHGIVAGNKVVIIDSGSATVDGVQTVDSVTSNTIVINVDGTGATATNASVYASYITIGDDYFFVGRVDITDFQFPAFYSGINDTYFLVNASDDTVMYYVYFHDTALTSTDPAISGKVGIKVDVSSLDTTGTLIATKVKNAIEAASYDFLIQQSTDTLRIRTANSGDATDASNVGVTGLVITKVQDGAGEDTTNNYVRLSTLPSPSQRIDDTARSLAKVVSDNTGEMVTAYYISGPSDVPGKLNFEAKLITTGVFTITSSDAAMGALFSPDITSAQSSTNEEKVNRLYYSKTNQPEAVPIVNYFDIGPQDRPIHRIIGLRDSLFVLKEEGIYRVTGDSPTNFQWTLFDSSSNIIAPDTAVVLNNQIYCFTKQGITTISETGVSIISTPIDNIMRQVSSPKYTAFSYASFGVAYEADYSYLIFLPKNPTDTTGTVCYRFNTVTKTWTTFTKTGDARSGIVGNNRKLYLGPVDTNLIEVERKNLTRDDYADRQYAASVASDSISGNVLGLSSISNVEVGDAFVQTQYLTISQITRIARKLAIDPGMPNTVGNSNKDYYRNYTIAIGANLTNELSLLVTQINSDLGTAYSTTFSSTFSVLQTEFNVLIAALNLNTTLYHTNYPTSTGTIDYEVFVDSVSIKDTSVTLRIIEPLIVGPMVQYKAISSLVTYNPMFFGEPSIMKHVREGVIMFENSTLVLGTLSYSSDLSANFEPIVFEMDGDGSWGAAVWSNFAWGGEGNSRPFRTLIPRQKQRCRFLRTKFQHRAAFDKYNVLGVAYTLEFGGERAYR